jgi:sensor histidine kinase YesM
MLSAWAWPAPRLIFGSWFVSSFVACIVTLYQLRAHRIIGPAYATFALVLWPATAVACALPVAWLWERRADMRHRRELAEVQRQRQEASLKLLVLQAQIEPHFLFNTLASLRALLREDARQAEMMVDALVRHLRAVLPRMRGDSAISTLADQLAICASYLELMATRLDGRLTHHIELPDALLRACFPPLMLLTLVENAVKHGIEPKSGHGHIRIEAERTLGSAGPAIDVRVVDDGVGLKMGFAHGLGLQNVREQLALRYGGHAALSLSGSRDGGVTACIRLPLEVADRS